MTEDDVKLARERLAHLKHASFQAGSYHKSFVRDTSLDGELSERQVGYIAILAWKYRRQIPAKLVPHGTPPNLPPKRKSSPKPPPPPIENGNLDLLEGLE